MANIRTFTGKGSAVSGVRRPGIATSPLGKLDPATGIVWQHPRIKQDPLSGSRVRVTNPKASTQVNQNSMTGSIGARGAGQRGRNRDLGLDSGGVNLKAKGEGN